MTSLSLITILSSPLVATVLAAAEGFSSFLTADAAGAAAPGF